MKLSELINQAPSNLDPDIQGLSLDSREVKSGSLFAAFPGAQMDGRKFIGSAIEQGAVAILAPEGTVLPDGVQDVALITDKNPRRLFSLMLAKFYDCQPCVIAAVTGTNGKTSTVEFARQLWSMQGHEASSLGTLGMRGAMAREGALTTPDPVKLFKMLDDLGTAEIDHVAIEASSHGLDQGRLDGVRVTAAAFTNLSRDHLDYHETMEEYFAAKAHLFTGVLQADGTAVLNADSEEFSALSKLMAQRGVRVLSYGKAGESVRIVSAEPVGTGQEVALDVGGEQYDIHLPLVGGFQVMNALCALCLVAAEEDGAVTALKALVPYLEKLEGVAGRLQYVPGHPRGAVYVDYAHTPDAVDTILQALRPHTTGRLIALVGCGGDRDKGKRPVMARIASEQADLAIVTDDNPRSEDPAAIRADMMVGAPDAKEIGGRREAIRWGVAEMQDNDLFVVAGKGHEQGQTIGDVVEPFDDVEEIKSAIELLIGSGEL